ncbi:hypothetical protein [Sphingobacterium sp. BIGb0116]|uniref:hypothetical protein n=1 Tax=Sphingobacterium sp. BIGb0116 TaxID=2940619 RepID=UPI002168D6C0|nr:hypothetical protein [Sphingobacterium sp. BIGb0116]MCS4164412.1 hypothetical protein [Sphingobacterium sp. BIGb0116]
MTKEEFFEKNDAKFLPLFDKDYEDPMFPYFKYLVDDEKVIELNEEGEDIPTLLYGSTGINSGFCIYTGQHFVWFNAETPGEAFEFASKITAFEEV